MFDSIPESLPTELTTVLAQTDAMRIERIVSKGHQSDADAWYDQEQREWVCVLSGHARLEFEDRMVELVPGSHLVIEAHERHRVAWTDPAEATVWIAVFY